MISLKRDELLGAKSSKLRLAIGALLGALQSLAKS